MWIEARRLLTAVCFFIAGPASAEPPPYVDAAGQVWPEGRAVRGLLCLGEARAILEQSRVDELREEVTFRLEQLRADRVPSALQAHTHCLVARLKLRLGDADAGQHFARAIDLNPTEPAYELFAGDYFRSTRGASYPHVERAARHYQAALRKAQARGTLEPERAYAAEVVADRARNGLTRLHEEDGFGLLPWAWPYRLDSSEPPQLFAAGGLEASYDTVDPWDSADVRRFTAEALEGRSRRLRARVPGLSQAEVRGIVRADPRVRQHYRLRLREATLGAIDVFYERYDAPGSQSFDLAQPLGRKMDVAVHEFGVAYKRSVSLYPAFDLQLNGAYIRQLRTGVEEFRPDYTQHSHVVRMNPVLSRFVGPDKLSVGGAYVWIRYPDDPLAQDTDAVRRRVIGTLFADYGLYRPFLLPGWRFGSSALERRYLRGVHVFLAGTIDDERFGRDVVHRRNASVGSTINGLGSYNLSVSSELFGFHKSRDQQRLPEFSQQQLRSTLSISKRVVDEDRREGMPLGALSSLHLIGSARFDHALSGPNNFESVRAGIELWTKLLPPALRRASTLLNLRADYQFFYRLDRHLWLLQLGVRIGWPSFGSLHALVT